VSSGLAYKAASGLAVAGLGYLVTLQLQLDWGWTPAHAAIGMLPQIVVLVAAGPFVSRIVERVGFDRAAWLSAVTVVLGLAVYSLLSRFGYVWVAVALVLVAAGIRVNGVVAGTNVLRGLPENQTSIGAALVDTASEVATAIGIAVTGTVLAALFTGDIATRGWSTQQSAQFQEAVTIAGLALTILAAALVGWGTSVRGTSRTNRQRHLPTKRSLRRPDTPAGAPVAARLRTSGPSARAPSNCCSTRLAVRVRSSWRSALTEPLSRPHGTDRPSELVQGLVDQRGEVRSSAKSIQRS